jgi:hypothetical protein
MKKYSKDPSITEHMEMPCPCDCGNWFDLYDGVPSEAPGSNRVICPECGQRQEAILYQIQKLEEELNDLEFQDKKPKRREKLRNEIEKLKQTL